MAILWNALPYNVVNASSVNASKSSLDKIPTAYIHRRMKVLNVVCVCVGGEVQNIGGGGGQGGPNFSLAVN